MEVQPQRPRQPSPVGRLYGRLYRCHISYQYPACAVVYRACQFEIAAQSGYFQCNLQHAGESENGISESCGRAGENRGEMNVMINDWQDKFANPENINLQTEYR